MSPAYRSPRARRAVLSTLALLVAGGGFLVGRASADQPHMHAALDHLRNAKRELEAADADKGGHRMKAIRAVDEAIAQTEKGMSFDRRH